MGHFISKRFFNGTWDVNHSGLGHFTHGLELN